MHHGHTLGNLCGPLPARERHFGSLDAGGWAEVARVLREGGWAYVVRGRADRLPGATVLMVFECEADLLPELPEGLMLAAVRDGAEEVVVLSAELDGVPMSKAPVASGFGALPRSHAR